MFGSLPVRPGRIVLDVWNCRVAVARYVSVGERATSIKHAENWEDLEDRAKEWMEANDMWWNMSGQYPCPIELAEEATWEQAETGD